MASTVPISQGYILFREKSAQLIRDGENSFIEISGKRGRITNCGQEPFTEDQMVRGCPVLLEFEQRLYLAQFVCKDPLAETRFQKAHLFEKIEKPSVEYKKEGDKTYRVVQDGHEQYWYWNDLLHREDDKPAVIHGDAMKAWYQNGKLHRDGDKPAYMSKDGVLRWHCNGKLHRDGGRPAYIDRPANLVKYFVHGLPPEQAPEESSKGRMEAAMFLHEGYSLGGGEFPEKPEGTEDDPTPEEIAAAELIAKKEKPSAFTKPTSAQGMNAKPDPDKPDPEEMKKDEFPRSTIRRLLAKKRQQPIQ